MSVAFAFEPGNKSAMKERPQNILKEGILSKAMLEFIGLVVCILSVFLLALYAFLLYIDMPLPQLRSVMFLVVAMDSLFIAFSFRALKVPVWRIPFWANKFFIGAFAVNLLLLLCVLAIPPLQQLLSYEPLPLAYVVLVVGYGLASMLVIELAKWVFFERHS